MNHRNPRSSIWPQRVSSVCRPLDPFPNCPYTYKYTSLQFISLSSFDSSLFFIHVWSIGINGYSFLLQKNFSDRTTTITNMNWPRKDCILIHADSLNNVFSFIKFSPSLDLLHFGRGKMPPLLRFFSCSASWTTSFLECHALIPCLIMTNRKGK